MELLVALALAVVQASDPVRQDVDRLVQAAQQLTEVWPSQSPPDVPQVADVVRHGKTATPLLLALLDDDPSIERDRRRWTVQQQASLALCRIYSESRHCGRVYCDGDPPERIARIKRGWLEKIANVKRLEALTFEELVARFNQESTFWRQFEYAQALGDSGDRRAIPALERSLTDADRHLRGNVALVLGRLGDPRGFDTIAGILNDRSRREPGQGQGTGSWALAAQIRSDRYYAAHLLGDLRDPRGVDVLVPLLDDPEVKHVVPWSLARIGDRRAVAPLARALSNADPGMRIYVIAALEDLRAVETLPQITQLLGDDRRATAGDPVTVAQAAKRAIAVLSRVSR